jgi:hypothetical protein
MTDMNAAHFRGTRIAERLLLPGSPSRQGAPADDCPLLNLFGRNRVVR